MVGPCHPGNQTRMLPIVKMVKKNMGLLPHTLTQVPESKITEFANRVDLDEVTHKEPPHLDLPCLPYSL